MTVINSGKSLLNTFGRHSVIVRAGVEAEAHADEDGKGAEHEEEAPHDSARHLDVLCNRPQSRLEFFIRKLLRLINTVSAEMKVSVWSKRSFSKRRYAPEG